MKGGRRAVCGTGVCEETSCRLAMGVQGAVVGAGGGRGYRISGRGGDNGGREVRSWRGRGVVVAGITRTPPKPSAGTSLFLPGRGGSALFQFLHSFQCLSICNCVFVAGYERTVLCVSSVSPFLVSAIAG